MTRLAVDRHRSRSSTRRRGTQRGGFRIAIRQDWLFFGFAALVFVMAGGSRSDIQSLLVIRPLAVAMIAYMLFRRGIGGLLRCWDPTILVLAALALLMLVQLVPLPPALWQALPGRGVYAEIDQAIGLGDIWRPLTLSPLRTLNAFWSLSVPIAGWLLLKPMDEDVRHRALMLLLVVGIVSMLFGMFQLLGGARSPFYIYRLSNIGFASGLFANRNHNAVFLAMLLPIVTALLLDRRAPAFLDRLALPAIGLSYLMIVVSIILTGSRAGVICAGLGLIGSAAILYDRYRTGGSRTGRGRRWIFLVPIVAAGLGSAATLVFSRSLAFDRLFGGNIQELRAQVLPQELDMVRTYWLSGIGFGAFERVYPLFEPDRLLRPTFLNNAHNDFLQIVIEGGLVAAMLAAGLVLWAGWRSWHIVRTGNGGERRTAMAVAVALVILLAGSVGDYPLRTPSMMLTGVILLIAIAPQSRRMEPKTMPL